VATNYLMNVGKPSDSIVARMRNILFGHTQILGLAGRLQLLSGPPKMLIVRSCCGNLHKLSSSTSVSHLIEPKEAGLSLF